MWQLTSFLPSKILRRRLDEAICAIVTKFEYVSPSLNIIFTSGRKSRRNDTDRTVFTLSGIVTNFTHLTTIGVSLNKVLKRVMSKDRDYTTQAPEFSVFSALVRNGGMPRRPWHCDAQLR